MQQRRAEPPRIAAYVRPTSAEACSAPRTVRAPDSGRRWVARRYEARPLVARSRRWWEVAAPRAGLRATSRRATLEAVQDHVRVPKLQPGHSSVGVFEEIPIHADHDLTMIRGCDPGIGALAELERAPPVLATVVGVFPAAPAGDRCADANSIGRPISAAVDLERSRDSVDISDGERSAAQAVRLTGDGVAC